MDDGEHTRGLQTGLAVPTTRVVHPRLSIEILDLADLLPAHRRDELAGMLRRASGILRVYSGDVRVRLVGDREMSAAHERFAGVPGTTDVLTFDMRDEDDELEPGGGGLDVDIWVCVDEARRRAAEFGHAIEREVLLYCLHGVLHCLGYDDHDPAEHARMHEEEDRVLEAIGVGRTYAPRRSAGAPDAGNEGDGGGVLGGGGGR